MTMNGTKTAPLEEGSWRRRRGSAHIGRRNLFRVARAGGLNDAEYAAIRALQEAAPASSARDPVWACPLAIGLVWISWGARPPVVRLTPTGRDLFTD
jgi:hypothetical protein